MRTSPSAGAPTKACAARTASSRRAGTEVSTIQWIRHSGYRRCSASTVAPQPISMSSQWAPMQRISSRRPARGARFSGNTTASALPTHPGAVALRFHAVEGDLVLERVHGAPESVVPIHRKEALLDEPLERLLDELVALLDVVEDVL